MLIEKNVGVWAYWNSHGIVTRFRLRVEAGNSNLFMGNYFLSEVVVVAEEVLELESDDDELLESPFDDSPFDDSLFDDSPSFTFAGGAVDEPFA